MPRDENKTVDEFKVDIKNLVSETTGWHTTMYHNENCIVIKSWSLADSKRYFKELREKFKICEYLSEIPEVLNDSSSEESETESSFEDTREEMTIWTLYLKMNWRN